MADTSHRRMSPKHTSEGSPNQEHVDDSLQTMYIVSSDAQSGTCIAANAISKSPVLQGLAGTTHELVLPVSALGLHQWSSWASHSSNCFSALSEGLQVAHYLNDAETQHSIVSQLADMVTLIADWSTPTGTQLAAALQSMPLDLCSLVFEKSYLDVSHLLDTLPPQLRHISIRQFITQSTAGQSINLAHRLSRSCMRPLSCIPMQHCVELDLTAASCAGPYPLPQRMFLPALTSLSLSKGRFTEPGVMPFLSALLQPTLRTLNLSYLHLKPQMYAALATSVAMMTVLTHLDLSHRLGCIEGSLCSKLLAPVFSAASKLPNLHCLAGVSITGLSCVQNTLGTLWKLPRLCLDFSECSASLSEMLSMPSQKLQALQVTLPPFSLGAGTSQVPDQEMDSTPLTLVLTAVAPSLLSLRLSSIRTPADVWTVPVATLSTLTSLTSLKVAYTPLDNFAFLPHLVHLRELVLIGTVPTFVDPAEFSTHLTALTALTHFEFDAGEEFDRCHVDPAVWSLGVDAGMLRDQLAASLPHLSQLAHFAFLTRDFDTEGDMDVSFVSGLHYLTALTALRLDSSFSIATPGFAGWLQTRTGIQLLQLMDGQSSQSVDQCVYLHTALGCLVNLTQLDLSWFGGARGLEKTMQEFSESIVKLTALKILDLHGSVHDTEGEDRKSPAIEKMLARALPALPQLQELSLQSLQLSAAEGVVMLANAHALTALSLCDLVFNDGIAARRFGAAVARLTNLRRLRTDWVELIDNPSATATLHCGEKRATAQGRSRLLSVTGWLLSGDRMWAPTSGLRCTLRVLVVEDYHGLDWGVLGARASCLSHLQALEIEGVKFERKPAHAEALLRQLGSLGNLEEVRMVTTSEAVTNCFSEKELKLLQKLIPSAKFSFVGYRMCGPDTLPLC